MTGKVQTEVDGSSESLWHAMKQFNLFCGTFHLCRLFLIPLMWWQIKLWSFPPMMNQIVTIKKLSTGYKYKCDQFHWSKKLWSCPLVTFINVTNSTVSKKIVMMSTDYIFQCDQFHWSKNNLWSIPHIKNNFCDLFPVLSN